MILTHLGLCDSKSSTASELGVGRASAFTARARDLEPSRMWGKETFPMDPAFREFREFNEPHVNHPGDPKAG